MSTCGTVMVRLFVKQTKIKKESLAIAMKPRDVVAGSMTTSRRCYNSCTGFGSEVGDFKMATLVYR